MLHPKLLRLKLAEVQRVVITDGYITDLLQHGRRAQRSTSLFPEVTQSCREKPQPDAVQAPIAAISRRCCERLLTRSPQRTGTPQGSSSICASTQLLWESPFLLCAPLSHLTTPTDTSPLSNRSTGGARLGRCFLHLPHRIQPMPLK